jgi:dolichyl-phosphate-mannose--protein O-mannosyl transferase
MSADASPDRGRSLARSAWEAVVAWGPRLSHPATGVLLIAMIVGGIVLRIQNVGYPLHYCFDEDQFVGAAHQFLIGVRDTGECCHPPLAKLFIDVGMLLYGNNPMGWRFMPLCFGIQNIVLAFFIASALFQDRKAGWLAAAFFAADGFYLSYSRIAFPEIMLAGLVLWAMLAAVTARSWRGVLASAIFVGLAASIKWSGFLAALPACFAVLVLRRAPRWSILLFAAALLVHLGVWTFGLWLIGRANDPLHVWAAIRERQKLHLGFTHNTNPAESAWYTWLVLYHPLIIKSANVGTTVRLASGVGNFLLWIAADACLLALLVVGAAAVLRARWRERWSQLFFEVDATFSRAVAILTVSWACMMLLWFTRRIVTYWYHYLSSWGFALMLLAGVVARLDRRFPNRVLIFVLLVLAVSVYFAPVWAELPISLSAAHRRLIFPLWQ